MSSISGLATSSRGAHARPPELRARFVRTAPPRNSRIVPQTGQATSARRVSRYARKAVTAGSSTSPPSAVTRPRTAPWDTGQSELRQRHSDRLMWPMPGTGGTEFRPKPEPRRWAAMDPGSAGTSTTIAVDQRPRRGRRAHRRGGSGPSSSRSHLYGRHTLDVTLGAPMAAVGRTLVTTVQADPKRHDPS